MLRPRDWTTAQSDWAADLLPRLPVGLALELCAGVGQIGLLAVLHSTRQLVCVDADKTACHVTGANAKGARMAARVEVRLARLEEVPRPPCPGWQTRAVDVHGRMDFLRAGTGGP